MRDNNWLLSRLDFIWERYFPDIKQVNPIVIKFGRNSRLRLGSIKLSKPTKRTHITITSMFKDESVPVEVVDQTIAHELVHYTHGFSSYRPRMHRYPHAGGIVNKELKKRGMENLLKVYKEWMKEYKKQINPKIRFRWG